MSSDTISKVKTVMLNGHMRALDSMRSESEKAVDILDWVEKQVIKILEEGEVDG